jgi:hypothetical protein
MGTVARDEVSYAFFCEKENREFYYLPVNKSLQWNLPRSPDEDDCSTESLPLSREAKIGGVRYSLGVGPVESQTRALGLWRIAIFILCIVGYLVKSPISNYGLRCVQHLAIRGADISGTAVQVEIGDCNEFQIESVEDIHEASFVLANRLKEVSAAGENILKRIAIDMATQGHCSSSCPPIRCEDASEDMLLSTERASCSAAVHRQDFAVVGFVVESSSEELSKSKRAAKGNSCKLPFAYLFSATCRKNEAIFDAELFVASMV